MAFGKSNRINYQQKVTIHISLTLLILAALIYFGIFQAVDKIMETKRLVETEKINLEKIYNSGKNLRKLTEDLRIVEPQLAKLENVFIKKEEALNFITSMEKISEKNGINQRINLAGAASINRGTEKNKIKNETIPIQLSSTGSFYKQMLYLDNLESLSYYINVKSLEISNSSFRNSANISAEGVSGGESESDVSIQLLADTYWQN